MYILHCSLRLINDCLQFLGYNWQCYVAMKQLYTRSLRHAVAFLLGTRWFWSYMTGIPLFTHTQILSMHIYVIATNHNYVSVEIILMQNHPRCMQFTKLVGVTTWLSFTYVVLDSIMTLMTFSDLNQSDCSNWVMWQVGDACPRPGWDGCLTWEKMAFIKSVKTWIILLYIWLHI